MFSSLLVLLASTGFLFTCSDADEVVYNVWQNQYLSVEDQRGIIDAMLEVTPPECPAHYYDQTDE